MNPKRILIHSSFGSYAVVCGAGVLRNAAKEIAKLGRFSSVHIISSVKVWRSLKQEIRRGIGRSDANKLHLFDDAESAKNLKNVESLCRALARARADRHALLVAVGGGVVGDVAGYVAASYLRGVALVHVPTTLVAQVDSAMGGKTGVNLPEGKNLVGSFYPPRLVLTDLQTLRSLPEREYRSGLAEVVKYGAISDATLFEYLEKNLAKLARREHSVLEHTIVRCAEIKARITSRDERESGLREILNFGHTFGHALESVTRYRRYFHGEAVAWGMMAASLLGHELGLIRADDVSRVVALVRRIGPLPSWPRVSAGTLVAAMSADKKAQNGKLRFVVLSKIGKARTIEGVSDEVIKRILHFTPKLLAEMENHDE